METIFLKMLVQSKRESPLWVQNFSKFLSTNAVLKYFTMAPFDTVQFETEPSGQPNAQSEENEEKPNDHAETVENVKIKEKPKSDYSILCRFTDRILFAVLIVCYSSYDG
jgi:hypothetical protein